jgi:hypothetical protein
VLAVAVAGVAAGGIALGVVETIGTLNDRDQAASVCPNNACHEPEHSQAVSLLSSARTDQTVAIMAGSVGGAALIGAVVLWFASGPSSHSSSGDATLHLVRGPAPLGLGWSSTF